MEMFEKELKKGEGQLDLGIKRTREELIKSILRKRKIDAPLDSEEQGEVTREREEDREEINNSYPH
ncbi:MAG: hypothetical protein US18_C0021G0002 [Parcubacteria group bacterium GW2011_GWB1_36_5]|nr:MAG: hypothetical protein US12_C0008G0002 [Parcubacteria group bacterium GW2011_GWA2_36_24]KKQ07270.1 MAG: hypothetical protein US18_C0021G0002 [Parcubacteria group bacterium GW2011_GWB1_36_5]